MIRAVGWLAVVVLTAMALATCGSDEPAALGCRYEQRSTSCSGSGFGDWEPRCLDVEDPREDLTPEGWCNIATGDTIECGGSCCINFQFRNEQAFRGLCSDP